VDRVPILALTGQVNTQVLGPGAFQEIPTAAAFEAVAEWSQTVLRQENAPELMALAIKHAVVKRDVGHLIFPNDTQEMEGLDSPPDTPRQGRIAEPAIAPPEADIRAAAELLAAAERPVIIVGHGARDHRDEVIELAEQIDAPIITTFKAKGLVSDTHPLGCGVLGRSGTPVGSAVMGRSDALLVLGASFSNHTGISKNKPTIQVDFDRMALGKFHPVDIAMWGEIGRTVADLRTRLAPVERPEQRADIARRWESWRVEKARRSMLIDGGGRMHPARLFAALNRVVPDDAVLPVDVGNNTYAFGHYFECTGRQDVIMSGYLGSIGFALPAALGAAVAVNGSRRVVSISGDGGLGQYLADFTTAVKYSLPIVHIVMNNDELAKISREQVGELRPVWQTSLVNPDFAAFAELCGGAGFRVTSGDQLDDVLTEALALNDRPVMVEVNTSGRWV
jgi:thiamine pyrophosphate-dependent acetolactate synthase large subunit-like protein